MMTIVPSASGWFGGTSRGWWLAMVAMGCLSDGTEVLEPASLARVMGRETQQAAAGSRVPLEVVVLTADARPVIRVSVRWRVLSGPGGLLSDTVTVTDGDGVAQVHFTAGREEGTTAVEAALTIAPDQGVVFDVITNAAAASVVGLVPTSFGAGDTVVVQGTDLTTATIFDVGGVLVPVRTASALGVAASIVIPSCLVPGPVTVRAVAGAVASEPVTATYTDAAGALELAPGERASLSSQELQGCARFPPAGPNGASYLVGVQSVTRTAGDSVSFRLSGQLETAPPPAAPRAVSVAAPTRATQFHDYLRDVERETARLAPPAGPRRAPAVPPTAPRLGQKRTFEVCDDIDCFIEDSFTSVRAEVRYAGDHAVIYLDENAPPGGFSEAQFQAVGALFDEQLYGVDTRAFGAESDVDEDGRVLILMTPVVNGLTPKEQCAQSFVTGFFFSIDINPAFERDPRSNQGEVFYSIVPDPSGTVTCDHTTDGVRSLVPVTFIHEFQHMINFYQHAVLRNGDTEELWLNEAMSHLAEELGAFHFRDLGDSTSFSRFAIGNLVNAYDYLRAPGNIFTLSETGTGSLRERGAGWLFLRWMVDQFGEGITRQLAETDLVGADNVEAATGEPLARLLSDWFLANWVSDLPDFEPPARLQYSSWAFRTTFASFNRQDSTRFDVPFPLQPASVTPPSFARSGVLRAGSGEYFVFEQPAGANGFTIAFTDPNGTSFSAATPTRFNVIRIQ